MRARYGITFTGLVLAGGTGVFLGMVPLGYLGLLRTAITHPAHLLALPGALALGALAGLVLAHTTRARLHPDMPHRTRRFVTTGLATLPGALFFGQIPTLANHHGSGGRDIIMFVLACGIAAMISYYRWRKRLAANTTPSRRDLHPETTPAQHTAPSRRLTP